MYCQFTGKSAFYCLKWWLSWTSPRLDPLTISLSWRTRFIKEEQNVIWILIIWIWALRSRSEKPLLNSSVRSAGWCWFRPRLKMQDAVWFRRYSSVADTGWMFDSRPYRYSLKNSVAPKIRQSLRPWRRPYPWPVLLISSAYINSWQTTLIKSSSSSKNPWVSGADAFDSLEHKKVEILWSMCAIMKKLMRLRKYF